MAKINAGDRNAVGGADSARANRIKSGAATTAKKTVSNRTKSKARVEEGGGAANYKETSAHKYNRTKAKPKGNDFKPNPLAKGSMKNWKAELGEVGSALGGGAKKAGGAAVGYGKKLPGIGLDGFNASMRLASGRNEEGNPYISMFDDGRIINAENLGDAGDDLYDVGESAFHGANFTGLGGAAKMLAGKAAARSSSPWIHSVDGTKPFGSIARQLSAGPRMTGPAVSGMSHADDIPTGPYGIPRDQIVRQQQVTPSRNVYTGQSDEVPADAYGGQVEDWMWNYAPERPTAQLGF